MTFSEEIGSSYKGRYYEAIKAHKDKLDKLRASDRKRQNAYYQRKKKAGQKSGKGEIVMTVSDSSAKTIDSDIRGEKCIPEIPLDSIVTVPHDSGNR
jgi:hypothetical protein